MNHHRAFSLLRVKSANDDQREITGIATSPTIDRVGDVVEPLGMKYKVPMPLLLNHDHSQPVGQAYFQRATSEGIPFRATLPKVDEAGVVKDRVDEAWHSLKHKLIGAVSVGFRVLPNGIEPLENGGLRFTKTECLEISLVAVPANPDAVITGIKALDVQLREAYGQSFALPDRRRETLPRPKAFTIHGTRISEAEILDTIEHDGGASMMTPEIRQHFAREIKAFERRHSSGEDDQTGNASSTDGTGQRAESGGSPNREWLVKFGTVLFKHVRTFVQPAVDELAARIDALDARIAAIEKHEKAMRYRGVWQPAETYQRGNFTTYDGSLWIAIDDAPSRPGEKGWQLCAKRGRDAK